VELGRPSNIRTDGGQFAKLQQNLTKEKNNGKRRK
jgi:hypothetical protein